MRVRWRASRLAAMFARRCFTVLVLALAACAASVPAASAKECRRGQIAWKLQGRTVCVPGLAAADTEPAALLVRAWVRRTATLPRRTPRKLRRAAPRVGGRAHTLALRSIAVAGTLQRRSGRARAASAAGPPVVARETITSAPKQLAGGLTLETSAIAKAYADDSVDIDFEFSLTDRNRNRMIWRPVLDDIYKRPAAVGCPTAAGVVTAEHTLAVGGTMIFAKGRRVIASGTNRELVIARARGQVGADARLQRVDTDVTFRSEEYSRGRQFEVTARAALSAPREGALAVVGAPVVDVRIRVAGAGAKAERAAELDTARQWAANPDLRATMTSIGDRPRAYLLENEKVWYAVPNDCAEIDFTPQPIARLAPGDAAQVQGRVKAAGGPEASAGAFTVTRVGRGRFRAARAATAPGAPALFTATAGEPDAGKRTVSADVIATSTAGRALGSWNANGERPAFPWRISGTVSSSQHALGWASIFHGAVAYDLQDVVPNPDGSSTATYELSYVDLPSVFLHQGDGCGYEGTGAGKGWTSGSVAMTRAQDGTVTYTLVLDTRAEHVRFHWVGCDEPVPPDFVGDAPAYLSAAPRTAEPGLRLRAVGATDVTSHNADTVTASWDITPCPAPSSGPATEACTG
jgi:hypothetical protein